MQTFDPDIFNDEDFIAPSLMINNLDRNTNRWLKIKLLWIRMRFLPDNAMPVDPMERSRVSVCDPSSDQTTPGNSDITSVNDPEPVAGPSGIGQQQICSLTLTPESYP